MVPLALLQIPLCSMAVRSSAAALMESQRLFSCPYMEVREDTLANKFLLITDSARSMNMHTDTHTHTPLASINLEDRAAEQFYKAA